MAKQKRTHVNLKFKILTISTAIMKKKALTAGVQIHIFIKMATKQFIFILLKSVTIKSPCLT